MHARVAGRVRLGEGLDLGRRNEDCCVIPEAVDTDVRPLRLRELGRRE
jgi:hypothetical protein